MHSWNRYKKAQSIETQTYGLLMRLEAAQSIENIAPVEESNPNFLCCVQFIPHKQVRPIDSLNTWQALHEPWFNLYFVAAFNLGACLESNHQFHFNTS